MAANLDKLHATWTASRSEDDLNALMSAVSIWAGKLIGDEDARQEAVFLILKALPRFTPKHSNAFRNFVARTSRGCRLQSLRRAAKANVHDIDIEVIIPDEAEPTRDYTRFTAEELRIIKLLELGHSLTDIASITGSSVESTRRNLSKLKCKRVQ